PAIISKFDMGYMPLDIQDPGPANFIGLSPHDTLPLGGTLKPIYGEFASDEWIINDTNNGYQTALKDFLNKPDEQVGTEQENPDPLISPPLYGRWHGLKRTLDDTSTDWFHEMNLDPRY